MTDLANKFTVDNTVMLLIDHQVGTMKLARNIEHAEIIKNTRALARTAAETGIPLVLTSSMETQFQGRLLEDLEKIAPAAYAQRVKRPGIVNCWELKEFRDAVLATGKRNIIMAGLTNDVCIVFPAISARQEGFNVQVVVDAGGSPTQLADEMAQQRMTRHGVVLTSTNQLMAELAYSWGEGNGAKIQHIMYEEILAPLLK